VRYFGTKLVQLVAVLLAVTFLTFVLIQLLPGDPAITVAGPGASREQVERIREDLGLDRNLVVQYVDWLGSAVTGDLGTSYVNRQPVADLIRQRIGLTIQLIIFAQVIALVVSIPLGIASAYRANTWFDKSASTTAFGLLSLPNFIIGVLLVYFFALRWQLFPAIGGGVTFFDDPAEATRRLFLPALTLALGLIAVYTRLLRTDMIATLQQDFIGVARAKGMPTWHILLRHAFRPSTFSLITVAGINVGQLIGGAFIVEQIFGRAGIGRQTVFAIFQRDYMVVQGAVVIISVGFVLINFAVDMLYAVLDPRIRHARSNA
jgi:peptide/nickel transport system permease protein